MNIIRNKIMTAAVFIYLLLSACVSSDPPAAGKPKAIVHKPSGALFADNFGSWRFQTLYEVYDGVRGSYYYRNTSEASLRAGATIDRAGRGSGLNRIKREHDDFLSRAAAAYKDFEITSSSERVLMRGAAVFPAWYTIYEMKVGEATMKSFLYTIYMKGWFVTIDISVDENQYDKSITEIDMFIDTVGLPVIENSK